MRRIGPVQRLTLDAAARARLAALAYDARMSERIVAPELTPGTKLAGPVSYFPSIEKKYGRPIQEWIDLVQPRVESDRHMEVVEWLKAEHGMGHGHANALVHWVKQRIS